MKYVTVSAKVKTHAKTRGLEVDERGIYQIKTPLAPDRGKANGDVIGIIAEHFKTSRGCVTIVSGQTSNRKLIKVLVP
ncbi:DUF167 domain-containing protein [Candidatus Uhrbacteria bacterium]|nr:DUF167 domain-containing protein [Candidatus Uhrbacteria bacterium]